MSILDKFRKKEVRAETVTIDDLLLQALVGTTTVDKQKALNIPSLSGCIEYISNTISMLPIKLYEEKDGKVVEIKNDYRLRILNDDTGDTLDSTQFWKALITDYFLGKGGYAYIHKSGEYSEITGAFIPNNKVQKLYYVDEINVCINKNADPIFKDYEILVNAKIYKPYEFFKILRKTKNGASGTSIISESPILMSVCYNSLVFENALIAKGGNKKGFLKSAKKLDQGAIDALKNGWKKLYSNNEENVVVLNDGIDFTESSNTSVEMQLNENKTTNSTEICKLFNVPEGIIKGTASQQEYINGFKMACMPVIKAIECALNKDLLLENEKENKYFAFDTKEITKGDIATRYQSYTEAVKAGWISKNEIRYIEDMEKIDGLDVVTMSLGEVIYDINSKTYFTPNTKELQGSEMKKNGGDDIVS